MPKRRQILAQPRQRPLVQEAGEIIGAVGQQLAAADADEQIEEFALDLASTSRVLAASASSTCARPSGVASPRNSAEPLEQLGVGRARQQRAEQRVFLRAREIDVVDAGISSA